MGGSTRPATAASARGCSASTRRSSSPRFDVVEDGLKVDIAWTVARLPVPVGGRHRLMARYDPEVMACQLNPRWLSVVPRIPARTTEDPAGGGVDICDVDGAAGIAGVRVGRGGHSCSVVLDPPMPDPARLPPGAPRRGVFKPQADGTTELRGRYGIDRAEGPVVSIVFDQIGP